jgi:hypothetical protein
MRSGFTVVEQVFLAALASNRGNLTLLLNLDLLTPTPSSDIRIKLNRLIELTSICTYPSISGAVKLRIEQPCAKNDPEVYHCGAPPMTLFELKKRLFLYFTDLLREFSNDADLNMPEVWIDGTGALVRDIGPSTGFCAYAADCWTSKVPKTPLIAVVERILRRIELHRHVGENDSGSGHDMVGCMF